MRFMRCRGDTVSLSQTLRVAVWTAALIETKPSSKSTIMAGGSNGCIECNLWRSNKRALIVELSVEDIQALRELKINGGQARSVR
jgi:hypothetical protein